MEWRVLEVLDPWGQRRDDIRIAKLSLQMAQWLGAKKQDGSPLKVEELLLEFADGSEDDGPTQTPEQIERHLLAMAKAHNLTIRRKAQAAG